MRPIYSHKPPLTKLITILSLIHLFSAEYVPFLVLMLAVSSLLSYTHSTHSHMRGEDEGARASVPYVCVLYRVARCCRLMEIVKESLGVYFNFGTLYRALAP